MGMASDGELGREDDPTFCSVVLHVDLDCFYAAVEQVRLGIPREKPLAVQQWRGLIAINYPARAAGITRHERAEQALKKCPELQLVHVEVIGEVGGNTDAPDRGHAKVSLERYRQASQKVFQIFRRFSSVYEKASIDEAYLDVTAKVEEMMSQGCSWDHELQRLLGNNDQGCPSMVVLDGPLVTFNAYDRRMLAGAIIANDIRSGVHDELGYTCSVGIATNKLLAKIASAKNKPNRQTLIPPRAVPGLMKTIPLKKMRLLGGKLGEELITKWGFSTAGDVQALPIATLVSSFGERQGNYVWNTVRGIQADKVQAKQVPKSMLAAKSFSPTKELADVRRWLTILAEELAARMVRDFQQNHRQPRLLQLYYRSGGFRHARDHSKSWSMPHGALNVLSSSSTSGEPRPEDGQLHTVDIAGDEPSSSGAEEEQVGTHGDDSIPGDPSSDDLGLLVSEKSTALAKVLEDAAFGAFKRLEAPFPCTRLALAASSFQDLGTQGSKSIEHFFASSRAGAAEGRSKGQSPSSGDASAEKSEGKRTGILRYLHHAGSNTDDEISNHESVAHSTNLRDEPPGGASAAEEDGQLRSSSPDGRKISIAENPTTTRPKNSSSSADLSSVACSDALVRDPHPTSELRHSPSLEDVREDDMTSTSHEHVHAENSKGMFQPLDAWPLPSYNRRLEGKDHSGVDIGKIDRSEQNRILADVQYSGRRQDLKSERQVRGRRGRNSNKRSRQSDSLAGGQQSIGKFFPSQGRPS